MRGLSRLSHIPPAGPLPHNFRWLPRIDQTRTVKVYATASETIYVTRQGERH
jgi:hypothetical protein